MYMFLFKWGRVTPDIKRKIDKLLAKKHPGVDFNTLGYPEEPRSWFATRNYGEPFNSQTALRVEESLKMAGIVR